MDFFPYGALLHFAGKKSPETEDEKKEIEIPTVSPVNTKPSPMPTPCGSDLDATMLGEALPEETTDRQWGQLTDSKAWSDGDDMGPKQEHWGLDPRKWLVTREDV